MTPTLPPFISRRRTSGISVGDIVNVDSKEQWNPPPPPPALQRFSEYKDTKSEIESDWQRTIAKFQQIKKLATTHAGQAAVGSRA
jgi:hypothetical protein